MIDVCAFYAKMKADDLAAMQAQRISNEQENNTAEFSPEPDLKKEYEEKMKPLKKETPIEELPPTTENSEGE